jgi:hypothetical protein
MVEALLAVSEALQDPSLVSDESVIRYKKWLSTFNPREIGSKTLKDDGSPDIRFMPPIDSPWLGELGIDFDDPGPTVEVLGEDLTRTDLIEFTHYLMTSSEPSGSNDARYAFIRGIRTEMGLDNPPIDS